jgi:drug/metabolite transporter (DMT)-like permease
MMFTDRQKGVIFILLCATSFAFLPTITRSIYAVSELKPTDIAFWRFVFANLVLWSILIVKNRGKGIRPLIPIPQIIVLGVLYALSALAAFFGLQYINASLFVVIFYTYPAMVALMSLLLGVRLSGVAWLAIAMTLVGVVLTIPDLSALQGGNVLGIGIALSNAFFVAIYYLVTQRFFKGVTDMTQMTAWVLLATLGIVMLVVPFFGVQAPQNLQTLGLLVMLAVVSTVVAVFTLNAGIQLIGATQASIVSSVEPAIAMMFAFVFIGESFTVLQLIGAGLIISAVIMLELSPKQKAKELSSVS